MANDSSTGGYLSPAVPAVPLEDGDLDAVLQQMVAGITGLAGSFVRPRWQPTVPKQPEAQVNWCAIGVTTMTSDDNPALVHDPITGDTLIRHEEIALLASFYGPQGQRNAATLRDGIYVPQNLEALRVNGIGLIDAGQIITAPELFNEQWVKRYDLTLNLRRIINRLYPVLNIASAVETITRN